MSCYAWEHGTITLPAGQAPVLRKLITAAAESRIVKLTADAERAWTYLKSITPAKRAAVSPWNCDDLKGIDGEVMWLLQRYDHQTGKSKIGRAHV